jgi:hypothetical protein
MEGERTNEQTNKRVDVVDVTIPYEIDLLDSLPSWPILASTASALEEERKVTEV